MNNNITLRQLAGILNEVNCCYTFIKIIAHKVFPQRELVLMNNTLNPTSSNTSKDISKDAFPRAGFRRRFGSWVYDFLIAFAVSFNEHFDSIETIFYLSGVIEAGTVGLIVLYLLAKQEKYSLDDYYGHAIEHKYKAIIFLLSAIALGGFPITTTFLGEDLLFSHVHIDQPFFMGMLAVNYVISGIAIMRIYARIFLGPNHKWYRPEARRSA